MSIDKLEGRDKVNIHTIANKVNEIIELLLNLEKEAKHDNPQEV